MHMHMSNHLLGMCLLSLKNMPRDLEAISELFSVSTMSATNGGEHVETLLMLFLHVEDSNGYRHIMYLVEVGWWCAGKI